MRPIATGGVAWSVCLSVGHVREPCKNGLNDRVPLGRVTRVDSKNHDRGADLPRGRGNFGACPPRLKALRVTTPFTQKNQ